MPEESKDKTTEAKDAKSSKRWMKNFSVGSKGGKRVVTIAGMTRFKGSDGEMVVMRSGDIGPVPDVVLKALNAGKHPTFVKVPKDLPVVGAAVDEASSEDD